MFVFKLIIVLISAIIYVKGAAVVTRESNLKSKLGNPLVDCLTVRHCTNCRGTGHINSFRTMDGTCNDVMNPLKGSANTKHRRILDAEYATDTKTYPRGIPDSTVNPTLPSAHKVAQTCFKAVEEFEGNKPETSILFMVFGQFIDHDITLVSHGKSSEKCPNSVSCTTSSFATDYKYPCNPIVKPTGTGCTKLTRTKAACQTSNNQDAKREQVNMITSYIDASNVYGSSDEHALYLRAKDGTGMLRMDDKNLLPIDPNLDEPCQSFPSKCFAAGDVRNSEHIGLATFHILWAREHNRIAKKLKEVNPDWSGSMIYYNARRIVIAEIQHILYNEWLGKIITLENHYYDKSIDPSVANGFAHAAYRFGHTLVPNALPQVNKDFTHIRDNIPLRDAFWNIKTIIDYGIDSTILGMVANESETVDGRFAKSIVRHLFIPLGDPQLADLSAINIHRGRDHGVPPYTKWLKWCTGIDAQSWDDIVNEFSATDITNMKSVYSKVTDIDLFVGGILENKVANKLIGRTFACIIKDQFRNLRSGDRHFYSRQGVFTEDQSNSIIKHVTMKRILCDNLDDVTSLQDDVFLAYKAHRGRPNCGSGGLDLKLWRDHPIVV